MPPLEYVTSVRGVVFRGNRVLVMRNRDEVHILPGGRREDGETLVETLVREVLEEAGWTLKVKEVLGFLHLRHLGPKPVGSHQGFPYLYPDFVHVVFLSDAVEHRPKKQESPTTTSSRQRSEPSRRRRLWESSWQEDSF